MCTSSIPRSMHHARKCRLVNSGPLSQRIASGFSRSVRYHLQRPGHSRTRKAGVHFQCQTFPRAFIHYAQHADRSPARQRIVCEIQRPFLVRRRQQRSRANPRAPAFTRFSSHRQPRFPVHAVTPACDSHAPRRPPAKHATADSRNAVSSVPTPPAAPAARHRSACSGNENSIPQSAAARKSAAGWPGNSPAASSLLACDSRAPAVF